VERRQRILAQKHLRSIKKGDRSLYHHTGDEKAVVGIAKALGDAYPTPTQRTALSVVDRARQIRSRDP
jgi:predicted RNA-binding protein with PUA-like domain